MEKIKDLSKVQACTTLHHGIVFDNKCQKQCDYFCFPPHKSSSFERYVNCDTLSGKWLTVHGEQPCILQDGVTSTKKTFDLNASVPFHDPLEYQNNIDFNDLQTYKPPELNIPTYKSWDFSDDDNVDLGGNRERNSGAVFGLIMAGIVGTVILCVVMRIWIYRCAARRRQERMQRLVQQLNSHIRENRETRSRQQAVAPPQSPSEGPNTEIGNEDEGIIIVRIRRFFNIPLLRNPYSAFRNPPEPPPYDAESVPPPAYEETEGSDTPTAENNNQPAEVSCTDTSEIPVDPPPPYTENII